MKKVIKNLQVGLALFVGGATLTWNAQAKVILYGSEIATIPVASDGPTILKFQSSVKTISGTKRFSIQPANKESPNYATLAVVPRTSSGTSKVDFMLSDGSMVRTRLKIISDTQGDELDSYYDLKPKEGYSGGDISQGPGSGSDMADMELMKALLRGDRVNGYEIKETNRSVNPGFKGIETHLVRTYRGTNLNGYIYKLENRTKKKLFINIQNMTIGDPNVAILSSVDNAVLEGKGSGDHVTYLRIVAKPNSIYNQLVLPVQIAEKKEKKS